MLDLSSLEKAIQALGVSIETSDAHAGTTEPGLKETLRAGVIQNFEVAFEQCWKFIQRWVRENVSPAEADTPRTRKELFRQAARSGLIDDPTPWFAYGDARNLTSHTYNEGEAEAVYRSARDFLKDAQVLLTQLKRDD